MKSLSQADPGSKDMQAVAASFAADSKPATRSAGVQALAALHEMYQKSTNSLTYDPTLKEFGRNVKKDVRIGPSAFEQDRNWLAGVIYHELVHSDQFDVYTQHGVDLPATEARTETERRMIALDECEAFYRTWQNRQIFVLSTDQVNTVWRRVKFHLIDVDDTVAGPLASKGQFAQARLALIGASKGK